MLTALPRFFDLLPSAATLIAVVSHTPPAAGAAGELQKVKRPAAVIYERSNQSISGKSKHCALIGCRIEVRISSATNSSNKGEVINNATNPISNNKSADLVVVIE